jgi:acyl dehydratase
MARTMGDANPMHHDEAFATPSRFGGLIACGPHISGLHRCMLPTWFSAKCAVMVIGYGSSDRLKAAPVLVAKYFRQPVDMATATWNGEIVAQSGAR